MTDTTNLDLELALDQTLTDLISFGLLAKQAHWNVVGPSFPRLHALLDQLAARKPASLKTCALVRKPVRQVEVPVDYLGFEIPDAWVVGYGLDYDDKWRTLPYIGTVGEERGAGTGGPHSP